MSIQIPFRGEFVDVEDITQEEWRSLRDSPHNQILIRFLKSQEPALLEAMRKEVVKGDLSAARAYDGYLECLKDLAYLLEQGISEELEKEKQI